MKIGQYLTFNIPKKALYLYNLTIRNENTYVPNLTFPVVFPSKSARNVLSP